MSSTETYSKHLVRNTESAKWKWSKILWTVQLFAIVFLRAKYAGAAVLHALFWTPRISLNIDLGLVKPGANNLYFSVKR